MPPDTSSKKHLRRSIANRASNIHWEPPHTKRLATPLQCTHSIAAEVVVMLIGVISTDLENQMFGVVFSDLS